MEVGIINFPHFTDKEMKNLPNNTQAINRRDGI